MENSRIISYFEENFVTLSDLLRIVKDSFEIFDGETRSLFDSCVNKIKESSAQLEELKLLFDEQKNSEISLKKQQNQRLLNDDIFGLSTENINLKPDELSVKVAERSNLQNRIKSPKNPMKQQNSTVNEETFVFNNARQNFNLSSCLTMKPITETEFNSVPAYMKGRIKLVQINELLDKFNEILTAKYELYDSGMKKCTTREMKDKWVRYKSEETEETKSQRFCSDDDIRDAFSAKEIQLFNKNVVQVFRHCKRLREIRARNLVRYVLIPH